MFCIIKCLGESISATRDVEKSISMIETLPSSLLKILENGSVWNILKPFDVPAKCNGDQYGSHDYLRGNKGLIGLPTARQLWSWLKVMKLSAAAPDILLTCCPWDFVTVMAPRLLTSKQTIPHRSSPRCRTCSSQ